MKTILVSLDERHDDLDKNHERAMDDLNSEMRQRRKDLIASANRLVRAHKLLQHSNAPLAFVGSTLPSQVESVSVPTIDHSSSQPVVIEMSRNGALSGYFGFHRQGSISLPGQGRQSPPGWRTHLKLSTVLNRPVSKSNSSSSFQSKGKEHSVSTIYTVKARTTEEELLITPRRRDFDPKVRKDQSRGERHTLSSASVRMFVMGS